MFNLLNNLQRVTGKPGVVHRVGKAFRTAARSHVATMNAEAPEQRILREAFDVSSLRRAFKAVHKQNLA